jgi:parvulin-like peptidyl-prolyl isomerase
VLFCIKIEEDKNCCKVKKMAKQTVNLAQKKIPVAKVNGVIISQYQVETGLDSILEPHKDIKGKVRLSQPEQYAARKQVIDNLVMRELLFQEGHRQGLEATEKEINHAIELSASEHQTEQQFKAMLLMQGLTFNEYQEQMRKDIIVNKMAAACVEGKRKPVTTADARKYYQENREDMKGPEMRKILHIEAPLDRYAPPEEENKVRQRLEKIKSPKEFEMIVSKGPNPEPELKADDLGYIRRGQFHPLLDPIAFRLPEGEVSRIVRTDEGLHLLLVKKVLKAGQTWPLEFIVEELKQKMYEMGSVAILNDFTAKLIKKAEVQIFDRIADSKLEQERQ